MFEIANSDQLNLPWVLHMGEDSICLRYVSCFHGLDRLVPLHLGDGAFIVCKAQEVLVGTRMTLTKGLQNLIQMIAVGTEDWVELVRLLVNKVLEAALVDVDVSVALDLEDELLRQLKRIVLAEVKLLLKDPEEV